MKNLTNIQRDNISKMLLSHSDHLCSAGEEYFQVNLWADSVAMYAKINEHNFVENVNKNVMAA